MRVAGSRRRREAREEVGGGGKPAPLPLGAGGRLRGRSALRSPAVLLPPGALQRPSCAAPHRTAPGCGGASAARTRGHGGAGRRRVISTADSAAGSAALLSTADSAEGHSAAAEQQQRARLAEAAVLPQRPAAPRLQPYRPLPSPAQGCPPRRDPRQVRSGSAFSRPGSGGKLARSRTGPQAGAIVVGRGPREAQNAERGKEIKINKNQQRGGESKYQFLLGLCPLSLLFRGWRGVCVREMDLRNAEPAGSLWGRALPSGTSGNPPGASPCPPRLCASRPRCPPLRSEQRRCPSAVSGTARRGLKAGAPQAMRRGC